MVNIIAFRILFIQPQLVINEARNRGTTKIEDDFQQVIAVVGFFQRANDVLRKHSHQGV